MCTEEKNQNLQKTDHSSVKEDSNMRLFESETDLLKKAFFLVAIFDAARTSPDWITKMFGIKKNPNCDNKIAFTANQLIEIFKKQAIELSDDQLDFLLQDKTNKISFSTYTWPAERLIPPHYCWG